MDWLPPCWLHCLLVWSHGSNWIKCLAHPRDSLVGLTGATFFATAGGIALVTSLFGLTGMLFTDGTR